MCPPFPGKRRRAQPSIAAAGSLQGRRFADHATLRMMQAMITGSGAVHLRRTALRIVGRRVLAVYVKALWQEKRPAGEGGAN